MDYLDPNHGVTVSTRTFCLVAKCLFIFLVSATVENEYCKVFMDNRQKINT